MNKSNKKLFNVLTNYNIKFFNKIKFYQIMFKGQTNIIAWLQV